jgi:type II secretory pathway component HofQ
VDSKTIIVAPDSMAKRRDFESLVVKTFYLPNTSQVETVEIITALRTLLNARYVASVADSNAIVMRDNPNRLALAERIISDMRKDAGVRTAAGFPSGSETGFILNRRAAQAIGAAPLPLRPKIQGTLSFDANDTTRVTYESIAATAGLRVVFDSRFHDSAAMPFKVDNVSIADALDFLSLQTQTIWLVMDSDTVLVAPDTPAVRSDLAPQATKSIGVTARAGAEFNLTDMVTALRRLMNLRQVSTTPNNAIVITDTPEAIALSEKLVQEVQMQR